MKTRTPGGRDTAASITFCSPSAHWSWRFFVSAFVGAAQSGDLEALTALLARDARVISDGGGKVSAALNEIVGADRAARFVIGVSREGLRDATARFALVNGLPGLIVEGAGGLIQTVAFELAEDDRMRAVYVVRNPEKLRHLSPATA